MNRTKLGFFLTEGMAGVVYQQGEVFFVIWEGWGMNDKDEEILITSQSPNYNSLEELTKEEAEGYTLEPIPSQTDTPVTV